MLTAILHPQSYLNVEQIALLLEQLHACRFHLWINERILNICSLATGNWTMLYRSCKDGCNKSHTRGIWHWNSIRSLAKRDSGLLKCQTLCTRRAGSARVRIQPLTLGRLKERHQSIRNGEFALTFNSSVLEWTNLLVYQGYLCSGQTSCGRWSDSGASPMGRKWERGTNK